MTNDEVLKALHQVELDVLLDIDAFCCEHQIAWWLDSGSALGAACRYRYAASRLRQIL